jgi:hypothetical protein
LSSDGPTFGLWYDFRQRPPFGDYARLYAECLEEIEEGEELGYAGVWLSEHHFVEDGYLPSPLTVAAAPDLHRRLRRPRDRSRRPDGGRVSDLRSLGRG